MNNQLGEIYPWQQKEQSPQQGKPFENAPWQIVDDLSRLMRLRQEQNQQSGALDVRYCLAVILGDARKRRLTGRIQTMLNITCQRCLQGFDWSVDLAFEFVLLQAGSTEARRYQEAVAHEESVPMGADSDDVWICGESLDLLALVEDELILSLPMVPRHEGDCQGLDVKIDKRDTPIDVQYPFADLKKGFARKE